MQTHHDRVLLLWSACTLPGGFAQNPLPRRNVCCRKLMSLHLQASSDVSVLGIFALNVHPDKTIRHLRITP